MNIQAWRDFDIIIIEDDGRYIASLAGPDGRRALGNFALPEPVQQLLPAAGVGERVRRAGQLSLEAAKVVGGALFEAIFTRDALRRLEEALDNLAPRTGLRIRLDLQGAPQLAELPWEFLFHPRKHFFLSLSPDTTFVRYVETEEPIRALRVEPPLRILGMASSPLDREELDLSTERRQLEEALADLRRAKLVEIDWLEENSLSAINRALAARTYHIFHFVGHGEYRDGEGGGEGLLYFEDEAGSSVPVSAEALGWVLRRSVKLAVLNACRGAQDDADPQAAGVASNLLLQGIPAVVAMQSDVSDAAAINFAYVFYGSIAMGLPIDAAVTAARRDVMTRFVTSAEWATPVLFMRSPDGLIFDVGALQEAEDAEEAREQREALESLASQLPDVDMEKIQSWINLATARSIGMLREWAIKVREMHPQDPPAQPPAMPRPGDLPADVAPRPAAPRPDALPPAAAPPDDLPPAAAPPATRPDELPD